MNQTNPQPDLIRADNVRRFTFLSGPEPDARRLCFAGWLLAYEDTYAHAVQSHEFQHNKSYTDIAMFLRLDGSFVAIKTLWRENLATRQWFEGWTPEDVRQYLEAHYKSTTGKDRIPLTWHKVLQIAEGMVG